MQITLLRPIPVPREKEWPDDSERPGLNIQLFPINACTGGVNGGIEPRSACTMQGTSSSHILWLVHVMAIKSK
jgi:hypothetical protein